MPVNVSITENLSDGYHVAVGSFKSPTTAAAGPVEMLLKETPEGLTPVLDNRIRVSRIMNMEIEMYVNAPVVDVKPVIGTEVAFTQLFHFKPKAN